MRGKFFSLVQAKGKRQKARGNSLEEVERSTFNVTHQYSGTGGGGGGGTGGVGGFGGKTFSGFSMSEGGGGGAGACGGGGGFISLCSLFKRFEFAGGIAWLSSIAVVPIRARNNIPFFMSAFSIQMQAT